MPGAGPFLIFAQKTPPKGEYFSKSTRRVFGRNLLYGMARGLGFTLGFSILGALAMMVLSRLAARNVPLIGEFLAEVLAQAERLRR